MPSMSDITLPTVLNIKEVQATFGSRPHQKGHQYHHIKYATGLSIKLVQTTYAVHIYINNITIYENIGMQDGWHGNLHIAIENWKCHCSVIQAKQITSTNTPRRYDVAKIQLHYGNSSLHTCTCQTETAEDYIVNISNSQFWGTGLSLESDEKHGDARVKL